MYARRRPVRVTGYNYYNEGDNCPPRPKYAYSQFLIYAIIIVVANR